MHDQPPTGLQRRPLRVVLIALPALALLVAVAVQDRTAALAVAGLGAVVAGFVALVASGTTRSRARSRRGAVAVLVLGGAGLFLGGTAFGSPVVSTGAADASATLSLRGAAPAPSRAAAPRLAADALAALPVKGPSPMTGYQRTARFGPAWMDVDRNGCDTRDDVLRRDLVQRTETRCKVLKGVLHDPYTGRTIDFVRGERTSSAVQIDHVVPLADAWRTGAQRLSQLQRETLANDPVNLYAVDGPTNTQKSDGDAATWLPKHKAFRCTYVAHQIAVKRAYGLWVTAAERAAMARVLDRCPAQTLPVDRMGAAVAGPAPAGSPSPSASTAPTASASPSAHPSDTAAAPSSSASSSATASSAPVVAGPVSPGAFCTDAGARGITKAGTAMVCRTSATDDRLRWRSAA